MEASTLSSVHFQRALKDFVFWIRIRFMSIRIQPKISMQFRIQASLSDINYEYTDITDISSFIVPGETTKCLLLGEKNREIRIKRPWIRIRISNTDADNE